LCQLLLLDRSLLQLLPCVFAPAMLSLLSLSALLPISTLLLLLEIGLLTLVMLNRAKLVGLLLVGVLVTTVGCLPRETHHFDNLI
jgi:hypothetical protein